MRRRPIGARAGMKLAGAHPLQTAGLAGDPGEPVHRLDARAKLLGWPALTLSPPDLGPGPRGHCSRAAPRFSRRWHSPPACRSVCSGAGHSCPAARRLAAASLPLRPPRRRGVPARPARALRDRSDDLRCGGRRGSRLEPQRDLCSHRPPDVPARPEGLRRLHARPLAGGDRRRDLALRVCVLAGEVARDAGGTRRSRGAAGDTCCTEPRPGGSPQHCSCAPTRAESACTSRWQRAAGRACQPRPRRSRCAAPTLSSSPRSPVPSRSASCERSPRELRRTRPGLTFGYGGGEVVLRRARAPRRAPRAGGGAQPQRRRQDRR